MSGVPLVATPPMHHRPSQFLHSEANNGGNAEMMSPFANAAHHHIVGGTLPLHPLHDDYGSPGGYGEAGPPLPPPPQHLSGCGPHPIESFEPPWKALSDFASANHDVEDFSQNHQFRSLTAQVRK